MKTLSVLKSCPIKLNDDTGLLVTMSYYSEKGNRSASEYRYDAKVFNISEMAKKANEMASANDDETFDWYGIPDRMIGIAKSTKAKDWGKFLKLKFNKMVDFETGVKILNGYKVSKDSYNANAKYDLSGLKCNGKDIDITSKESWLSIGVSASASKVVDKKVKPVVAKIAQPAEDKVEEIKA